MKRIFKPLLSAIALLFLANFINAQAPTVTWEGFYPGDYELGNYTANDIKQSPYGGYVLVGSRKIQATNGYNEVMVMRVDEEGSGIWMRQTFGGTNFDSIPWDQEAYDMIFTHAEDLRYLVTGFRDTTLTSVSTPPGLLLMEISGLGIVYFDSLYYNANQHHIMGRCIQPAIGGGYIIAGSIREDGGGTDKIMLVRVVKNEAGKYDIVGMPLVKNQVGDGGYASWIRQFGDGYLLGGSAINGDNKFDLFIQRIHESLIEDWTLFYGMEDSDEFADALISTDHVYLAGSAGVPVPGTSYYNDQIYVVKTDLLGDTVWTRTYGGPTRHYANKIIKTGDGNLLVAGTAYDLSMHTEMVLLKIDAETGDSLWMQSYGTNFMDSGIRDAIRTADFGYLVAGRGSVTMTQDPRIYIIRLNNSTAKANLALAREGLNLDIVTGTPTKDVINVTADKIALYGICVKIDSLLHPSVGDLEISLEHSGTTVTLVDQPFHSGENFIHTNLIDAAEVPIESGYAPYFGWFLPEEPLLPFLLHEPTGEWTLTITDHGTGGIKATTRVLEGWSLNLMVESGSGTQIPTQESFTNFGLEQVRPNPFNQEALISFRIPEPGHVKLTVYNQLGQVVGYLADEDLPEGLHERMWYPGPLAPGTYFIHLESGGMVSVRKAVYNL